MYVYMRTYVHTYLHTYIPTFLHSCIPAYLHTYIPTYIHTIPTYIPYHTLPYLPTYIHGVVSKWWYHVIPLNLGYLKYLCQCSLESLENGDEPWDLRLLLRAAKNLVLHHALPLANLKACIENGFLWKCNNPTSTGSSFVLLNSDVGEYPVSRQTQFNVWAAYLTGAATFGTNGLAPQVVMPSHLRIGCPPEKSRYECPALSKVDMWWF